MLRRERPRAFDRPEVCGYEETIADDAIVVDSAQSRRRWFGDECLDGNCRQFDRWRQLIGVRPRPEVRKWFCTLSFVAGKLGRDQHERVCAETPPRRSDRENRVGGARIV